MTQTTKPPLPTRSLEHARELRRHLTDAERKLWERLRAGRLAGLKFRRQHPVPPYVADFYCDAAGLVIELDGSQHTPDGDAVRTRWLESRGLRVLRFWDHEVLGQLDAVLQAILMPSATRPSPQPLSRRERGLKHTTHVPGPAA